MTTNENYNAVCETLLLMYWLSVQHVYIYTLLMLFLPQAQQCCTWCILELACPSVCLFLHLVVQLYHVLLVWDITKSITGVNMKLQGWIDSLLIDVANKHKLFFFCIILELFCFNCLYIISVWNITQKILKELFWRLIDR